VGGGRGGTGERLRVDVALVLERQPACGELRPQPVQRDPALDRDKAFVAVRRVHALHSP
jgi:hypothetical protein